MAGAGCQHSASGCWNLHLPVAWYSMALGLLPPFSPCCSALSEPFPHPLAPWADQNVLSTVSPLSQDPGGRRECGMNVELPSRSLEGRPCGQRKRVQAGLFCSTLVCWDGGPLPTTWMSGSPPARVPSVAGARAATPTPRAWGSLVVSVSSFFSFSLFFFLPHWQKCALRVLSCPLCLNCFTSS